MCRIMQLTAVLPACRAPGSRWCRGESRFCSPQPSSNSSSSRVMMMVHSSSSKTSSRWSAGCEVAGTRTGCSGSTIRLALGRCGDTQRAPPASSSSASCVAGWHAQRRAPSLCTIDVLPRISHGISQLPGVDVARVRGFQWAARAHCTVLHITTHAASIPASLPAVMYSWRRLPCAPRAQK